MVKVGNNVKFEGVLGKVEQIVGKKALVVFGTKGAWLPVAMLEEMPTAETKPLPEKCMDALMADVFASGSAVQWGNQPKLAAELKPGVRVANLAATSCTRAMADLFKALAPDADVAKYRELKDAGEKVRAYKFATVWVVENLFKSL